MKFCESLEDAQKAIDYCIELLLHQKKFMTKDNYNHYSIMTEQNRHLEPIRTQSEITGFRQVGPDNVTISVVDTSNLGKEFISDCKSSSPWDSPSQKDVEAVDEALKKTEKVSKKQREKIASRWRKNGKR